MDSNVHNLLHSNIRLLYLRQRFPIPAHNRYSTSQSPKQGRSGERELRGVAGEKTPLGEKIEGGGEEKSKLSNTKILMKMIGLRGEL